MFRITQMWRPFVLEICRSSVMLKVEYFKLKYVKFILLNFILKIKVHWVYLCTFYSEKSVVHSFFFEYESLLILFTYIFYVPAVKIIVNFAYQVYSLLVYRNPQKNLISLYLVFKMILQKRKYLFMIYRVSQKVRTL